MQSPDWANMNTEQKTREKKSRNEQQHPDTQKNHRILCMFNGATWQF